MKRDSFIFYRSFQEAIDCAPEEKKLEIYKNIIKYALDGEIKNSEGISKSIFILIKPNIDANNKRYKNGIKGGRPKHNQNITKTKPKHNQNITKPEPNVDVDVDVDVDDDVDVDVDVDDDAISNKLDIARACKKENKSDNRINELINYLETKLEHKLDGSVKSNRYACFNLLRRFDKQYNKDQSVDNIKLLIDLGLSDSFHSQNITNFSYIFRHAQQIANLYRKPKEVNKIFTI